MGVYDTDDAFIDRLRARGAAATGKPRLIVESFPYGGSVIDGWNDRLTAVLPSGTVLVVEAPDLQQPVAHVYDDSPDVRAIIASVGGAHQ